MVTPLLSELNLMARGAGPRLGYCAVPPPKFGVVSQREGPKSEFLRIVSVHDSCYGTLSSVLSHLISADFARHL